MLMRHFYSKYLVEQPKFRTCLADHSVHVLFNNCRMIVFTPTERQGKTESKEMFLKSRHIFP